VTVSPTKFRPTDVEADVDEDGEVAEWEDSPTSNFFAWASVKFTPTLCQEEHHWSVKFANHLWTSCHCCMLFRGITIGLVAGIAMTCLVFSIAWLALR
jgi:hypothetical protein